MKKGEDTKETVRWMETISNNRMSKDLYTKLTNSMPRGKVLIKKLVFARLVKEFSAFYGQINSLQCSQELNTGPYPGPCEQSPPSFHSISLISI